MKKLLVAALLLALFLQPTTAQQEYKTFGPLVSINWSSAMSNWKIVVPEITQNYCLNPSAEIAGNFAAVGGGTHTRVTTAQFADVYSYRVQTAANDEGGDYTLLALSNNIHYVTMRVAGTLPAAWYWSLDNAAYTAPALLETIDATWSLYGLEFPAPQATGAVLLYVRQNGAGAGDFNIDGIQIEQKTYWTTYCDGTRLGCEWNGAVHASTSQRSAVSRAGGLVQDLQDDYNFEIGGMIATGLPAIVNAVDSYAILPGGELNSIKVELRVFTLTGVIRGTSLANLHANRQALLDVLKPNAVPEDADGPQPVRLRYVGAAVQKQIAAHYEGGLEIRIEARMECWERLAIRFLADDPYWYEIGDSAAVWTSTSDTATFRLIAARLRSTGQWDELGPPAVPGTAVYTDVRAIAIQHSTLVYIGGLFLNWNNNDNSDRIVSWDGAAYSPLGTGCDDAVYAMVFLPDGTLIAGGAFTSAGGVPNTNRIAAWDGAVWAPLNLGFVDGEVRSLAISPSGVLYAGGSFTTGGGSAGDRVAYWDGAAWQPLAGGGFLDGSVFALKFDSQGNLYAGGSFTVGGGSPANYLAIWDGANWGAVGGTETGIVYALEIDVDDTLYIGGAFINWDGIASADQIAMWNGQAWNGLGTGLNSTVWSMNFGPDGVLYVSGAFTQAGGIDLADRVAKWNGSSWAHLDIDLPGTPAGFVVVCGDADPVIEQNYDIYLGFDETGIGSFAGTVMATNDGTEGAFPKFIISRTDGTSAILEEIRNETAGKELLFDYSLLDGEELMIDLTPTQKSITSSFFGSRLDAILANSDFGIFILQSGNNQITAFVATDATVFAYAQWKDKFLSQD